MNVSDLSSINVKLVLKMKNIYLITTLWCLLVFLSVDEIIIMYNDSNVSWSAHLNYMLGHDLHGRMWISHSLHDLVLNHYKAYYYYHPTWTWYLIAAYVVSCHNLTNHLRYYQYAMMKVMKCVYVLHKFVVWCYVKKLHIKPYSISLTS